MSKFLARIVACLLIPCLIADPIFAAVSSNPAKAFAVLGTSTASLLFQEQALNNPDVGGQFSRILLSAKVRVAVILTVTLGLLAQVGVAQTPKKQPSMTPFLFGFTSGTSPLLTMVFGTVAIFAVVYIWPQVRRFMILISRRQVHLSRADPSNQTSNDRPWTFENNTLRLDDRTIEFVEGNIAEANTAAIANPAAPDLYWGSGAGRVIMDAAGEAVKSEVEALLKGPSLVPGNVVVTGAGRLKARYLIHTIISNDDRDLDTGLIRRATQRALEEADRLQLASLAVPAFGTGNIGLSYGESAELLLSELTSHLAASAHLKKAVIVLYGDHAYRTFIEKARTFAQLESGASGEDLLMKELENSAANGDTHKRIQRAVILLQDVERRMATGQSIQWNAARIQKLIEISQLDEPRLKVSFSQIVEKAGLHDQAIFARLIDLSRDSNAKVATAADKTIRALGSSRGTMIQGTPANVSLESLWTAIANNPVQRRVAFTLIAIREPVSKHFLMELAGIDDIPVADTVLEQLKPVLVVSPEEEGGKIENMYDVTKEFKDVVEIVDPQGFKDANGWIAEAYLGHWKRFKESPEGQSLPFSKTLPQVNPWRDSGERNSIAAADARMIWALYRRNPSAFEEEAEIATIIGPIEAASGDVPLMSYIVQLIHELDLVATRDDQRIQAFDTTPGGHGEYFSSGERRRGPVNVELKVEYQFEDSSTPATAVLTARRIGSSHSLHMRWWERRVRQFLGLFMSNPPEWLINVIVSTTEPGMLMIARSFAAWLGIDLILAPLAAVGFGAAHTGKSNRFKAFATGWGLGVLIMAHLGYIDSWQAYLAVATAQFITNVLLQHGPKFLHSISPDQSAFLFLKSA